MVLAHALLPLATTRASGLTITFHLIPPTCSVCVVLDPEFTLPAPAFHNLMVSRLESIVAALVRCVGAAAWPFNLRLSAYAHKNLMLCITGTADDMESGTDSLTRLSPQGREDALVLVLLCIRELAAASSIANPNLLVNVLPADERGRNPALQIRVFRMGAPMTPKPASGRTPANPTPINFEPAKFSHQLAVPELACIPKPRLTCVQAAVQILRAVIPVNVSSVEPTMSATEIAGLSVKDFRRIVSSCCQSKTEATNLVNRRYSAEIFRALARVHGPRAVEPLAVCDLLELAPAPRDPSFEGFALALIFLLWRRGSALLRVFQTSVGAAAETIYAGLLCFGFT